MSHILGSFHIIWIRLDYHKIVGYTEGHTNEGPIGKYRLIILAYLCRDGNVLGRKICSIAP